MGDSLPHFYHDVKQKAPKIYTYIHTFYTSSKTFRSPAYNYILMHNHFMGLVLDAVLLLTDFAGLILLRLIVGWSLRLSLHISPGLIYQKRKC